LAAKKERGRVAKTFSAFSGLSFPVFTGYEFVATVC